MELLALGLGFLVFAAVLARFADAARRRGEIFRASCLIAQGEVDRLVEVQCDEPPNTWAPIIRFETQDEGEIEFQTLSSAKPPEYRVGQSVEVFYPPQNPEKGRVKAEALDYDSWVVIAVAAAGIGLIGLTALFYYFVK